ncbi:phytanoyl-CoA dioxygenase family protein [Lentzea sp.]|uniref:phytanoyl-CoA dioxygenase family protein n=1 Tax=Lentzea sp. TaxID=56099 RepID=UPI002ED0C1E0
MESVRALEELGVRPGMPGREVTAQLDEQGFAFVPGVLNGYLLESLRARLNVLSVAGGGARRLADLVNKGEVFTTTFTHPVVLAAVEHVLGDFKLSSVSSRAVFPGEGRQPLHADWDGAAPVPGDYRTCNTAWVLDDWTERSGALRVVPGSHRWGRDPRKALADPWASHPGQQLVTAPAGSLLIFNGHLWHGGTRNRSAVPRRAVHACFTRRHHPQQLDQARHATRETLDRLSPAARFVLDA